MIQYGDDLRPIILDWLRRTIDDRPDTAHAHVSDCYGCDLATWARRNGKPMMSKSPAIGWKLGLGHDVERRIAMAIAEEWPTMTVRNERIAWNPYTLEVRRDLLPPLHDTTDGTGFCAGCPDCQPQENEVIGHLDLGIGPRKGNEIVGEVKSIWFGVEPPTQCSPHYIVQTSTYSTAIKARAFFIQVLAVTIRGKRVSLELAEPFWFKTEDYRETAIARAKEVIERTAKGGFPPVGNPMYGWLCKVCAYAECERNINPDKDAR